MTYCVAWKKDGIAFLSADSAISSFAEEPDIDYSTFGEKSGLYDKIYVSESALKLIEISNKCLATYSGNQEMALNVIEMLKNSIVYFDIETCLGNIMNSIDKDTYELELIILVYSNGSNRIYYFGNGKYYEVEDFVEIGSGKMIPHLSNEVKLLVESNVELPSEPSSHLAGVITFLQCSSIKNQFFNYGVGGAFFGVQLNGNIIWADDITYYIYDDEFNMHLVSIVSRYSAVFSASSDDNVVRYFFNQGTKIDIDEDLYIQRKIRKILDTLVPNYFIFYNPQKNCVFFNEIDRWAHNSKFRYWLRRLPSETMYAFIFDPIHRMTLEMSYSDNYHPAFYNVAFKKEKFMRREDFYSIVDKISNMSFDDETFDIDLRAAKLDFEKKLYSDLNDNVSKYKNIILVDYEFFCEILNEKYSMYSKHGVTMDEFCLPLLIKQFLKQIASDNFEEYCIYVIKKAKSNFVIGGVSITNLFNEYDNCYIVDANQQNYSIEFSGVVLELIKNYYHNDDYFHLDKLIICADNQELDTVLELVPRINIELEKPDIILIRNFNRLTNMDGRFRYVVIDYAISFMFGLTMDEIGYYESF